MRTTSDRFPFIALEGTDGSGKSTLRSRLAGSLRARGYTVTEFGQFSWLDAAAARRIVGTRLGRAHFPPLDVVRSSLRDKHLHHRHNIAPAQATGPVLVDRYVLSDVVYHHVLHGAPVAGIRDAMRTATMTPPDAVVFVDTPPDIAWSRVQQRAKQLRPYEKPDILRRLYECYVEVLEADFIDGEVIRFPNADELDDEAVERLADRLLSVPASP